MSVVYTVPAERLEKTNKSPKEIFDSYFKEWGYNIFTEEFGDIAVKNSSVRSEVRHGITSEKNASIEAIPTVLAKGKVIFAERKQGTNVERLVVAAPIKISNAIYFMGVMLKRDVQNQRLYIHDVEIDKETTDFTPVDLLTTGTGETKNHLFMTNVLQRILKVKYSDRKNTKKQSRSITEIDGDYMSAVENGDMEAAQRLVDEAAETEY